LLALVALASAGCGRSLDAYLAERKTEVAEKLAALEKVRALVRQTTPIAADTMTDPGPMSICDLVVPPFRAQPCNTWVTDLAQFVRPDRYLDPRPVVTFGMANWFVLPASLVTIGRYPPNQRYPEGAEVDGVTRAIEAAFRWLANVEYVIVVRTLEEKLPTVSDDQKSYNPGTFRGEALLFQLEPEPTSLGGIALEYTTAGNLQVHMQNGQVKSSELEAAFARGVRDQLAAKLVTRLQNLERPVK
jgi:hypothetical protein